jgi:hypothetical protein
VLSAHPLRVVAPSVILTESSDGWRTVVDPELLAWVAELMRVHPTDQWVARGAVRVYDVFGEPELRNTTELRARRLEHEQGPSRYGVPWTGRSPGSVWATTLLDQAVTIRLFVPEVYVDTGDDDPDSVAAQRAIPPVGLREAAGDPVRVTAAFADWLLHTCVEHTNELVRNLSWVEVSEQPPDDTACADLLRCIGSLVDASREAAAHVPGVDAAAFLSVGQWMTLARNGLQIGPSSTDLVVRRPWTWTAESSGRRSLTHSQAMSAVLTDLQCRPLLNWPKPPRRAGTAEDTLDHLVRSFEQGRQDGAFTPPPGDPPPRPPAATPPYPGPAAALPLVHLGPALPSPATVPVWASGRGGLSYSWWRRDASSPFSGGITWWPEIHPTAPRGPMDTDTDTDTERADRLAALSRIAELSGMSAVDAFAGAVAPVPPSRFLALEPGAAVPDWREMLTLIERLAGPVDSFAMSGWVCARGWQARITAAVSSSDPLDVIATKLGRSNVAIELKSSALGFGQIAPYSLTPAARLAEERVHTALGHGTTTLWALRADFGAARAQIGSMLGPPTEAGDPTAWRQQDAAGRTAGWTSLHSRVETVPPLFRVPAFPAWARSFLEVGSFDVSTVASPNQGRRWFHRA